MAEDYGSERARRAIVLADELRQYLDDFNVYQTHPTHAADIESVADWLRPPPPAQVEVKPGDVLDLPEGFAQPAATLSLKPAPPAPPADTARPAATASSAAPAPTAPSAATEAELPHVQARQPERQPFVDLVTRACGWVLRGDFHSAAARTAFELAVAIEINFRMEEGKTT